MRSYPAHLSTYSLPSEPHEAEHIEASADAESIHPLTAELRKALENPGETSIGAFAGIVERIMGDLNVAGDPAHMTYEPVQPGRAERLPTRTYIPMTEEEEQRIVDYFVARQWGLDKSPH